MYPELFKIGPITIHTYGVMVALGITLGIVVAIKLAKVYQISTGVITDIAFWGVIVAIVSSRLGFVLLSPSYYFNNPLEILKIWEGGLVFGFGALGGIITLWFMSRKNGLNFFQMADVFSPGLALGEAVGRIGCFFAGCCYGLPTDSWCAITFTDPKSLAPTNVALYPTQLFHFAANLVIFLVLLLIHAKKRYQGQVLVWYMILHSIQRLFIERFRGDFRGYILDTQITLTQGMSLLVLVGGVMLLFFLKRRQGLKT